jgi:hypothetical protein
MFRWYEEFKPRVPERSEFLSPKCSSLGSESIGAAHFKDQSVQTLQAQASWQMMWH